MQVNLETLQIWHNAYEKDITYIVFVFLQTSKTPGD
jgi:hypothetical protein